MPYEWFSNNREKKQNTQNSHTLFRCYLGCQNEVEIKPVQISSGWSFRHALIYSFTTIYAETCKREGVKYDIWRTLLPWDHSLCQIVPGVRQTWSRLKHTQRNHTGVRGESKTPSVKDCLTKRSPVQSLQQLKCRPARPWKATDLPGSCSARMGAAPTCDRHGVIL